MVTLESLKTASFTVEGEATSGVQVTTTSSARDAEGRAHTAIAEANHEFRVKTDSVMALPIAILVEQRDRAIRALEDLRGNVDSNRAKLVAEQDSFIAFLTEDHHTQLAALEQQLTQAKVALERQAVLTPIIHAPLATGGESDLRTALERAEEHVGTLREQLENAYREVDESRSDAWRLQEERDEAIRATDDMRIEFSSQLEATRDEVARLQLGLDETQRAVEDTRDEAREEASRMLEDMEVLKTELDERRAEVTRLRDRLEVGDQRQSRPPPPAAGDELEKARAEAKVVRKQLIDTKREVARLTRELELARAQRGPLYRHTPQGGLRPATRTGTTQPGLEGKPPSIKGGGTPPPSAGE